MAEDKDQNTDTNIKGGAKTTDLPPSDAPIVKEAPKLPDGVVASLPEDGALHTGTAAPAASAVNHPPVFSDKFAGQGGSFIIDGNTGERKRQYSPIYQDGQVVGFRPVA